jgi:hypothetical protein
MEAHTCGTLHAFTWSSYYFGHILGERTCRDTSCYCWRCIFIYFMEFQHGQNSNSPLSPWLCFVGGCPLTIFGFAYFILHIHPWSWLPWDLHMWIGCMHLVDHFLFLEVGYEEFSYEEYFIVISLVHLGERTL